MKKPEAEVVRTEIGPEHADCVACELHSVCHGRTGPVLGERPLYWEPGGLMIIGEGPGGYEVSYGRPFVGPSGRLLDKLLASAEIDRSRCWVTNATLGKPDPKLAVDKKGAFSKRYPSAVYSCIPRLDEEIRTARPRVIVTLGRGALHALTGIEREVQKLVPNPCTYARCHPSTRKIGPVIACANGECDWFALAPSEVEQAGLEEAHVAELSGEKLRKPYPAWRAWGDDVREGHGGKCPSCGANINRLRPKMLKCTECGGKKRVSRTFIRYDDVYPLLGREGAAGAIFDAEDFGLAEHGVKYIVPTYHPSFCLRPVKKRNRESRQVGGQYAARVVVEHLIKAKRLLTEDSRWSDPLLHVTDDPEVAKAWLAERGGRYACDVETNSYGGPWKVTQVSCIGFAHAGRPDALVIDTRDLLFDLAKPKGDDHPSYHALYQRYLAVQRDPQRKAKAEAMRGVLRWFFEEREDVQTVWHNSPYDRVVMHRIWDVWDYQVDGDTQYDHSVCYPDEEHGLAFVGHELADVPYWKGDNRPIPAGEFDELSGYDDFDALALYNAKDCKVTAIVDEIIRGPGGQKGGRLDDEEVREAANADLRNLEIGVAMEICGMPIDQGRLQEIERSYAEEMERLEAAMAEVVGREDWVPRGKDLLWALYDPMGPCRFDITSTTATGRPSADKATLKGFRGLQDPDLPALILKWRQYEYNQSHYIRGKGLTPDAQGRIHPQWKPGLLTGRWSTSPNLQNWPKYPVHLNMRRIVVAPPGRAFVGADYAQLELRIMASLSGDDTLIELIRNADESDKLNPDKDPHSFLARAVFGSSFEDAGKKRKALRDCVKRVWYGSLYGAGALTIMHSIEEDDSYSGPKLTRPFVEGVLQMIEQEFPKVQAWRARQVGEMRQNLEVRSPMVGRHRIFPLGDTEITIAYNYPIQSGAADLMNWKCWELHQALPDVDPTAFLMAQVHDAIYVECAEERAEDVRQLVESTLTVEYDFPRVGGGMMLFEAAAEIGQSWDQVG